MMKDPVAEVLDSIFTAETGWLQPVSQLEEDRTAPAFSAVRAFAELLATRPNEEEPLQQFLEANPKFITGMFGVGDDAILAVLTKPPVGTRLSADFGVLTFGQGGCGIHLIEIETASEPLFTAAGVPAKRHNHAIGQIRDWHEWVHPNRISFMHDMMARVESLPEPPAKAANMSFRTRPVSAIQSSWRGFGGYDDPVITYTLIMGRWAQLNAAHKKRLLQFNKHESKLFELFTYDQLIRSALERPYRNW